MTGSPVAPVLLIVFNRPDLTRQVLQAVAGAAPRRLFVAADGPRPGRAEDQRLCRAVLDLVRSSVRWPCTLEILERGENLGCGRGPASAISWFFERVEEGIILEDDCLPAPEFFPFCSSLLAHYRDEPRVGQVAGFNCQFGRTRGDGSYYFSQYFHCWGWATWRRAWRDFDYHMTDYPQFLRDNGLERLFSRRSVREFWKGNFDSAIRGDGTIWDYQWVYCNLKAGRLSAVPNWNMIRNIGFGSDATHTRERDPRLPPVNPRPNSELVHPGAVAPDLEADEFTYRNQLRLNAWHDVKQVFKRVSARARS